MSVTTPPVNRAIGKPRRIAWTGCGRPVVTHSLILGYRGVERRPRALYAAILGAAFRLGLINAFKHSQDAWSSVGALGLILSILCAVLAVVAGVLVFSDFGLREDAQ